MYWQGVGKDLARCWQGDGILIEHGYSMASPCEKIFSCLAHPLVILFLNCESLFEISYNEIPNYAF